MAATVPETTTRVVAVLGQLVWAYFARMEAGDRTGATVALRAFQATYNQHVAALRAVDPGLPLRVDASGNWNGTSRWIAQVVLDANLENPEAHQQQLEAMPLLVDDIPSWFRDFRSAAPTGIDAVSQLISGASPAAMANDVTSYVTRLTNPTLSNAPNPTFDVTNATRNPTSRPSADVTAIDEPLTIQADPTKWSMPLWALAALGVGAITATGVLLYYVGKKRSR